MNWQKRVTLWDMDAATRSVNRVADEIHRL